MQWSDELLDELADRADPEADQIAAAYRERYPDLGLRDLVRQVRTDLYAPATETTPVSGLPRPVLGEALRREDLLRRGQEVFHLYGLEMACSLYFASLPMSYAVVPAAEALARTSDLATNSLNRRIAETGQMMVDVLAVDGPDLLRPGSRGYATCRGVRLMHAVARALIRAEDEQARAEGATDDPRLWDTDELGEPLNQEMMLATILAFSYVAWIALERFGVSLDSDEKEAHAYAWSVVAALLGVDEQYLPLGVDDMEQLAPLLFARHIGRTDAGVRLTAALIGEMEEFAPLGFRRVPASLIRWLFKDNVGELEPGRIADDLDVPEAARWATVMFEIQSGVNRLIGPLRDSPAGRWYFRRVGRLATKGFIDRELEGEPPFHLPPEVTADWRVRTGPGATRVRQVRARGRAATRTMLARRGA